MKVSRSILFGLSCIFALVLLILVVIYIRKDHSCGLSLQITPDSQESFYPCGYILNDSADTTAIFLGKIKKISSESNGVFLDIDLGVREKIYLGELNNSNISLENRTEERTIISISKGKKVAQKFDSLMLSRLEKALNHYVLITVPTFANDGYLKEVRSKLQNKPSKILTYINDCPEQIKAKLEQLKAKEKNLKTDVSERCPFWTANIVVFD